MERKLTNKNQQDKTIVLDVCWPLDPHHIKEQFCSKFPELSVKILDDGDRFGVKSSCRVVIFPSQQTVVLKAMSECQSVQNALEEWTDTITTALKQRSPSTVFVEDVVLSLQDGPIADLAQKLKTDIMPTAASDIDASQRLYGKISHLAATTLNHEPALLARLQKRAIHSKVKAIQPLQIDNLAHEAKALTMEYKSRNHELHIQIKDTQSRLGMLRSKFTIKVREVELATTDMLKLYNQKDRDLIRQKAEAKAKALKKSEQSLQLEIRLLRSSTSWRITAPLRRLSAAIRPHKSKR